MKLEKRIPLYAFEVEYTDQREPKPRTVRRELFVLDRDRVAALDLLQVPVPDWIAQQYNRQGYFVQDVRKAGRESVFIDTAVLWQTAAAQQLGHAQTVATAPAAQDAGRYIEEVRARMAAREESGQSE